MKVVGLDLSLKATGIARYDGMTMTLSGEAYTGAERLRALREGVLLMTGVVGQEAFDTERPDLVCIEGYSFNSRNGGERLGELGGVIRLALHENQMPWVEITPAKVKKLATGKGNAAKEEVFAAAIRRLNYKGSSLDEADALWVREIALQHFGEPTADLPAAHLVALKGIEWPEIPGLADSVARHPAGASS